MFEILMCIFVGLLFYSVTLFIKGEEVQIIQKGSCVGLKKNILVYGGSGCGKSYLAKQLSLKYNLHFIELDDLRFLPNWQSRSLSAFKEEIKKEMNKAEESSKPWIIDGRASKFTDLVSDDISLVIWLDYPYIVIFLRLLYRTVTRWIYKEKCCGENYESLFTQLFTSDSLFLFQIRAFHSHKENLKKWIKEYPHLKVLRFTSPKACSNWFNEITSFEELFY